MQKFAESDVRFRTLADTAPVMIWMAGMDALCYFFNRTWLDFTGHTLEQEQGNGWTSGVHPADVQGCLEAYLDSFEARQPFRVEFRLRRADGEYRWVLNNGIPQFDPNGEFEGFIGTCVDINHQKEVEAELKRHADELERFAYISSHDLQEPLRMISNYTQLLARKYEGKLDAQADQYIAYAAEGANRIRALIDDLLEYSHAGKFLTLQNFPLRKVVDECIHKLPNAVRLDTSIEVGELPEVRADREQIGKVITQILDNSIKYRSEVDLKISIEAKLEGDRWLISICDNGIGISARYHNKVFEIFQRLHSRVEYSGTGAGLALCKKILERHGNRIWIESELGKGCTVWFTLHPAA